jgi:hypothetical protein
MSVRTDGLIIYFQLALKVLLISIATVKAHTQPGTGVILFQVLFISSNFASQCILLSIIVNHTSIIIESFLTISTLSNQGLQAAKITISDLSVKSLIFGVLLLQLITVAQAFISKAVMGFQTILLLQITVIIFQTKFISILLNISIIPAGVQGMNQELSQINAFH